MLSVWVSVEVMVPASVLAPIRVSVVVRVSVEVTLLSVEESVEVTLDVMVLGWLALTVMVLTSTTVGISVSAVGKPLAVKLSLLDSVEISWYGPHCDGVAESVSVAVPWSVVVTPPMLEKSLLVALWLSVSVP